ncbi:MAG: biopolymer transporter ExbD [Desulfobacterota bacterium]|nr:biopolymer transporter ExbD [Thermodesulfobacteriota bacterium]
MNFKIKRKRSVTIEITPIVDTVFNLLIFFALTLHATSFGSLDITLPAVSTLAKRFEHPSCILQINQSAEVQVNNEPVALNNLEQKLRALKKDEGFDAVVIYADERVPHGIVVRVMDICKRSGVKKISIAAEIND